jgi:hypothetical protein
MIKKWLTGGNFFYGASITVYVRKVNFFFRIHGTLEEVPQCTAGYSLLHITGSFP